MNEETSGAPMKGGHERTDIDPKYVAAFAAILVCVAVLLYGLVWGFFAHLAPKTSLAQTQPAIETGAPLFPSPRLQVDPRQDLEQLRTHETDLLGSYGWVDRDAGIVRIPIDRAIDIVSQKGLPDFGKPKEGPAKQ